MLPKKNRLTTKEWDVVFKSGRRIKSPSFTFVVMKPTPTAPNRVGVSVSKKVGKTAVVRNATKRIYMAYLDDFGRKEGHTTLGVIVHTLPNQETLQQEIEAYVGKI
jgi:ribonuclease P protein component